jgi:hypothetical protein
MRVLKPTIITDSMGVSASVAETEHPAYSALTDYAIGGKVIYQHNRYEALVINGPATAVATPGAVGGTTWLKLGPTNLWSMFDNEVNTQTIYAGDLIVYVRPGLITSVMLLELVGVYKVKLDMVNPDNSVRLHPTTGAPLYSVEKLLDSTVVTNWFEYFFEPFDIRTDVSFEGLPAYRDIRLRLTLYKSTSATEVKIGAYLLGTSISLGISNYGAEAGINDYSKKETNEYGVTTLVKRTFSKRNSFEIELPNEDLRKVHSTLANLRATPCVWIPTDDITYSPLVVYGWYKDFSINVPYPTTSTCSLQIEGLI